MIAVGKISKSIGIKGEFKVTMFTDRPERFRNLEVVWIGADETTAKRHRVRSARVSKTAVVLGLEEIHSRSGADERRGEFVFVEKPDEVAPKRGSYYIHEIIGMNVVKESGEPVGIVQDVLTMPANDVWVVVGGNKEYLIPAIKQVIRSVDVRLRKIVIRPMEGLLD